MDYVEILPLEQSMKIRYKINFNMLVINIWYNT